MNKQKRQEILLEIITNFEVDTQEEISSALENRGLTVTQATVSRDIKELGLIKTSGKTKKFKYAKPVEVQKDSQKLLGLFKTAVLSVEQAQNLVIIKTLSGNGSAVAASIDARHIPEIVGTLAGDDTVLVVARDNETATNVVSQMRDLL